MSAFAALTLLVILGSVMTVTLDENGSNAFYDLRGDIELSNLG